MHKFMYAFIHHMYRENKSARAKLISAWALLFFEILPLKTG
jgi:hypothetical protein